MEEVKWAELLAAVPQMILEFSKLGVAGWIAGGVFAVLLAVGLWLLHRWLKGIEIERMKVENERRRNEADSKLPQDTAEIGNAIREGRKKLMDKVLEQLSDDLKVKIKSVEVQVPVSGAYRTETGWARGAVVHYTAGRPVENEEMATAQLRDMASKGYGAFLVGVDGTIYAPSNLWFNTSCSHAGESSWKGITGLSLHCFGIEVSCPGKLDGGKTWWGDQADPLLVRSSTGEENIQPGDYWKFTPMQEEAVLYLLAWHVKYNRVFDIEFVVGHDEIAPGRKSDPGASLSMTMPELRELLAKKTASI